MTSIILGFHSSPWFQFWVEGGRVQSNKTSLQREELNKEGLAKGGISLLGST